MGRDLELSTMTPRSLLLLVTELKMEHLEARLHEIGHKFSPTGYDICRCHRPVRLDFPEFNDTIWEMDGLLESYWNYFQKKVTVPMQDCPRCCDRQDHFMNDINDYLDIWFELWRSEDLRSRLAPSLRDDIFDDNNLAAATDFKHTDTFSSGEKEYYVAGSVNGTVVEALPDTGAEACFISPRLASRLGLRPTPGSRKRIILANKKVVKSPGMVTVPWTFANERNTHTIHCWILPGCISNLVLGNDFLKMTNALDKVCHRIKSKLLGESKQLSLSYLGNEKQRLRGYLNGHLTTALPDTGSDAMLINGAYARKIGLEVDNNIGSRDTIRLADGSTTIISGIVRDIEWKVGSKAVYCNFYVLEDLCVDVILSNNYLFGMHIFSEQEEHFFHMDSEDHFDDYVSYFCGVRVVEKKNVAPPLEFSLEMTQHELKQLEQWEKEEETFRRDENSDWRETLPEEQQEKAAQDEEARRQCWEASRKERRARWAAATHMARENVSQ